MGARPTPVVTEEKVFLPSADELRAAEMEQALEVDACSHLLLHCNMKPLFHTRWKVLLEPLVCAICSLMTTTQLGRGEAAVRSGRKWMVLNLSARLRVVLVLQL